MSYDNDMYYRSHLKKRKPGYFRESLLSAVLTGIFIVSLLLNIFFVLIFIIAGIGSRGVRNLTKGGYIKEKIGYEEVVPGRGTREQKDEIALIDCKGFISGNTSRSRVFGEGESFADAIEHRFELIKNDPTVKGVLLIIDSPGGLVSTSDYLYHVIRRFKRKTGIPVVSFIEGTGASGAYYIASATDLIIAAPTSITGSIGVIVYGFNVKGLMDRYGVQYVAIKSGRYKDLISPFKAIDKEEIEWMQSVVDELYKRFLTVVSEGRTSLSMNEVKSLADGRIFTAQDAKKLGLIDEVGYFDDAVKIIAHMAHVEAPQLIRYRKRSDLRSVISGLVASIGKQQVSFSPGPVVGERRTRFYYLWDIGGITIR